MSWWQLAPAVIVTAAMVFLPGYVVVRCWRVSGLVAVGVAAPLSISLMAVVAVLAKMAGLRWGVFPVLGAAALLAVAGLVFRLLTRDSRRYHHPTKPLRARWHLLVHFGALLIPAVLLLRGLTRMVGAPDHFSQTYDNVFHLNAIRFILETGSGSSLTLGGMYSNGARPAMYPAAWHDLVSLVVQVTGSSLPEAINAVTLVVGALVWPIGAIFFATRLLGMRPVPVLFAGALSATFGAFPYLMADFGVLYPFFMSIALLPAGLALVTMSTGVGVRGGTPRWMSMVLLVAVVPSIALAHPSTLLVLLLLALPVLVVSLVRYRRRVKAIGRAAEVRYWLGVVLMLGYVVVGVVIWKKARPSANGWWPPIETIPQAVGKVIAAGFSFQGPTWVVFLLTLVAIGLVMRRQIALWLVGMYVIAAGLYVVVAAAPVGRFRDFITGVWYNDPFRLAGQLPVIIVVMATVAATWLYTVTLGRLAARRPAFEQFRSTAGGGPKAAVAAFVVALVMGVAGQYSSVNYEVVRGQSTYSLHENSIVVSTDELALMERLDDEIPEGDSIIGNPWTGTALAYAFSGRRTLTPHVGGTIPPDIRYVMDNLDDVEDDPKVCSIVRDLRAYWVLDFDGRQVHDRNVRFDGLDSLFTNPGVDEVDHEGLRARLYRITAC